MRKPLLIPCALLSAVIVLAALSACQPAAAPETVQPAAPASADETIADEAAAVSAPAVDPLESAAQFIASGNEPGWIVYAGAQGMRIKLDYGETVHAVAPVNAGPDGWSGSAEDGTPVRLSVTRTACVDDMSGKPHESKVMLTVGTRQLHGCGGNVTTEAPAGSVPAP